ncbi:hypothetical protein JVT61DRAFT_7643 [Boletus reticuloceps]|uniref:Uncharacterized protein n=1 Tax=Boletus reticuloceps TaxID=495285 RepID=A0A8I2YI70_9AGAM|nr:hypothetical protein JVT61DRAFT_7643 [Boletus reticuloceps]
MLKPHACDFSALSSVLRLSTKYFIEHPRTQCLARLIHDWPTTLADWGQTRGSSDGCQWLYLQVA